MFELLLNELQEVLFEYFLLERLVSLDDLLVLNRDTFLFDHKALAYDVQVPSIGEERVILVDSALLAEQFGRVELHEADQGEVIGGEHFE